ncbi:MAG: SMI1/KNR4 family protein [Synechococcaceae cyanobacterium SM2_3_1]|nr:SMI1/KNR4 family protein [Synechococcaceae cyanobacterium SM2_3_1]
MDTKNRLYALCERIHHEGIQIVDIFGKGESNKVWSGVMPKIYWHEDLIEDELKIKIPEDLKWLWDYYSSVAIKIYDYGISGLYIYSPDQALVRHKYYYVKEKELAKTIEDLREGDFIIGEYFGEQQFVLIRCDEKSKDFGSILMTQPIDPREEWPIVATSLIDFLETYYLAGDMFWDNEKYWRT